MAVPENGVNEISKGLERVYNRHIYFIFQYVCGQKL